ncbi:LacI family DNA-binding transcriptional regulator [Elusimicrobiota bacterium]
MEKKIIGLIIPPETHLFSQWAHNYYFTEILRGAIAAASLFEWNIMIHHKGFESMMEYVEFCREEGIKGIVCMAPALRKEVQDEIKKIDIPVIVINGRYPGISFIDTDNRRGAQRAVKYLMDMGHREIAMINGNLEIRNAKDRFEGYKDAMSEVGLEINEDFIRYGNFSEDSGKSHMEDILQLNKLPTAILCANDLIAIGVMKALEKNRKVKIPRDISLIGFDDLTITSYLKPPLTTVRQPLFHLGKEAMVTLIGIIRGETDPNQSIEIETRLIKRDSVAVPREK